MPFSISKGLKSFRRVFVLPRIAAHSMRREALVLIARGSYDRIFCRRFYVPLYRAHVSAAAGLARYRTRLCLQGQNGVEDFLQIVVMPFPWPSAAFFLTCCPGRCCLFVDVLKFHVFMFLAVNLGTSFFWG